ncbi:MAG: response regulator, partial [Alphaproteobacteria bacterium]|nr:response regulator [Alphaproteobacteria bacterium]
LYFVVTDLSVERQWGDALVRAEGRFHRLVDEAPLGIAAVDAAGRVADANHALAVLAGVGEADLPGLPFLDLVGEADRAPTRDYLDAMRRGASGNDPLDIRAFGKPPRPVQILAGRPSRERGDVLLFVVDMSERRNLEQRVLHAQKMQAIGQMAGGVAHDFNNLLTAMIGHCDLLLERHPETDPSFADLQQIKQNAARAASLVRQLLAFSRRQTLRPETMDPAETLRELGDLLRRVLGTGIALDIAIARDAGLARADASQLEQVVVNLAVNARDAMPKGGDLRIGLRRYISQAAEELVPETVPAGDYVRIDVVDTGIGVVPEHLDKIFEPFFTTKPVGSGTGLGLATAYGIIRQSGGWLAVASVLGQGTTFSIFLPRIDPANAPAPAKNEAAVDLTGRARILLAEDELAVRSFAARALRAKGYEVVEAPDGEAALAAFEREGGRFDLLVTDVMMPGMQGPELIRRVRALRPDLKVIVTSGFAEDAFAADLGDAPTELLPKPFALKDLAAKVRAVLGGGSS